MNDSEEQAERERRAENKCNHDLNYSHRVCTDTPGGHRDGCTGGCDWCWVRSTVTRRRNR